MRNKFKLTFTLLGSYAMIVGLITFPLFIHEEAIQTIMFGTWAASSADDHEMVLRGVDAMRVITKSMRLINLALGWINPLSFSAYQHFATAADYYAASAETKSIAKKPDLLEGRKIFRYVTVQRKYQDGQGWIAGDGKVFFRTTAEPVIGAKLEIRGRAESVGGKIFIEAEHIQNAENLP